jgi:hypothetical protein
MERDYIVSPEHIVRRAVSCGLLSQEESTTRAVLNSAEYEACELAASWPEDEGFGSSDMTFVMEGMLRGAGFATEYRDHRLCRKAT